MIDIKSISENIRKCRRLAGLTQAQLAEKMFIAPQTVSKWERGLSVPSISELSSISDILDVPIGALLVELPHGKREVMIAVDGGGTKTEILLFTVDGEISRAVFGACNPNVVGIGSACEVLCKGIDTLLAEDMRLTAVYCGIAGAGVNENASLIQAHLRRRYPSAKVRVESDLKNAVGLADDPDNCIAVIMGTGSSVLASVDGRIFRVGGWGYIFDGAGSGYDIGREVIKRTLAYEDGIGERSCVVSLCQKRLGSAAYPQIAGIYERGVDYIASFASIAFEAARQGDTVALGIIKESTDRICALVKHAVESASGTPSVIFTGGLCASGDIILPLIQNALSGIDVRIAELPQIFGAVKMCLLLSGAKMSSESLNIMKKRYSEALK